MNKHQPLRSRRMLAGAMVMLLLAGCFGGGDAGQTAPAAGAFPVLELVPGQTLPAVLAEGGLPPDLRLLGGAEGFGSLADLRGKRVFMTFWNTWCPYCRQALPEYDQLRQDLQADDIVWLFVNHVPGEQDGTADKVAAYLAEHQLTTPVALDLTGEAFRAFGGRGVPLTVVLDAEGLIVAVFPGAAPYSLAELALAVAADPSVLDNLESGGRPDS